jgi:hypothetical protein
LRQSQIDLQRPAMASLLGEQLPEVQQHFDLIGVAAENSLEKLDLEIELGTLEESRQSAAAADRFVRCRRTLLIFARHNAEFHKLAIDPHAHYRAGVVPLSRIFLLTL